MDKKIAVIAIMVYDRNSSFKVNELLHSYSEYVLGRMGIPYREKVVNVISVVMDAPQEILNSLSGKLGMIENVTSKVMLAK